MRALCLLEARTSPPCTWSATTPSASCAAAVLPPARISTCLSSAPITVASTPRSAAPFEQPLGNVACVACGQCIVSCPTGALTEKDNTQEVIDAINDPSKVVIVQTAPAVRAALGEEFGLPIGTNVEGKMVAALRRLGFDKVFDTDFGADMTIMEEANEFIDRVKNGGVLPMITSCSPGWIKFCEHYYPDLVDHLSSCKSPQNMTGALIKTWYAQKEGIDPNNIVSVSVMPCTAKKFEIQRDDENGSRPAGRGHQASPPGSWPAYDQERRS